MGKYTDAKKLELAAKIVGTKINRLTILEYLGIKKGKSIVKTQCECGTISIKIMNVVLRGQTKSCGCLIKETATTHGLRLHPLYGVWYAMVNRCTNTKDKSYKNYGGRGVEVCKEWINDFIAFYSWAINNGWKPGLNLDKDINGSKLYSPDTCSFVTRKENNNNTRHNVFIVFEGTKATIKGWSEITGIPYGALARRLKNGLWPIEKALTEPFKPYARC